MKLVIDANIPAAEHCLAPLGTITRLPGRVIGPSDLLKADALIVRSVTPVNRDLLEQSAVRFVGSCTIGTDHIDHAYLEEHGIAFASAPGCNAEAVVDYVLSSLLTLAERDGFALLERRVGIVGAGNVGERLRARLQAMGMAVQVCDPPRAEQEGSEGFAELDDLIAQCDVLCLHTPLVAQGEHATRHLLDAARVEALAPGTVLLNAGRGDCLDGAALVHRLKARGDITTVLDVWENEPAIDAELYAQVSLATPHIAGHSLDGKLRGTWMIQQALAAHLEKPSGPAFAEICPPPALCSLHLQQAVPLEDALRLCMRAVYDVRRDHDALARAIRRKGLARGFDECRVHYPLRREFATLSVTLSGEAQALEGALRGAGFSVFKV